MTKEQYLNYVMLTEPKERWSVIMYRYVINEEIVEWKEGFDFVIKWCGPGELSASLISYYMVADERVKVEWAMKVIEEEKRNNSDHPSTIEWAAQSLYAYQGAPKEWYQKILNKEKQTNV